MVSGVVIAGIIILCVLIAAELVHIFFLPSGEAEEVSAFTVLVYRKGDIEFEDKLHHILSQLRWTEPCFCSEIYIVNIDVPESQSVCVREICDMRKNLVYVSIDEFIKMMRNEKNSL